jgi:hypothetical protein
VGQRGGLRDPIRYEYGRLARAIAASAMAFAAAAVVPDLPPVAGILGRGTIVVVVFCGLLWMSGFFKREEMQVLGRLRRRTGQPAAAPEAVELAGQIVAADLPEPPKS